MSLKDYI